MSRRAEQRRAARQRRRRRLGVAASAAGFLAALIAVVVVIGGRGGGESTALGTAASVRVVMSDFAFDPDPVVVSGPDKVVAVVNTGNVPHDLVVPELGKGTPDLVAGEEFTIDLSDQPAGTYQVICDLPGHREAGMVTELVIEPGR